MGTLRLPLPPKPNYLKRNNKASDCNRCLKKKEKTNFNRKDLNFKFCLVLRAFVIVQSNSMYIVFVRKDVKYILRLHCLNI